MAYTVRVVVRGRPSYLRWTLERWFEEIRDIVEGEYGVRLHVDIVDSEEEYPLIEANGKIYFEGLPGEEGYLIEIVKRIIEDFLSRSG